MKIKKNTLAIVGVIFGTIIVALLLFLVIGKKDVQQCPALDCSQCPAQIETKTVTKYQCYDGSLVNEISSCPMTELQVAQENCPSLSTLKPRQNAFDKDLYTVDYEENKLYDGWKIRCGFTCSTNCRKGKEVGENVNYYYCGKNVIDTFTLEKTITDKQGNILEVITKDAVITYNQNLKYVDTVCG